MPFCSKCGAQMPEGTKFCTSYGATVGSQPAPTEFLVATTPTMPGYRIKRILGVVTGMTARTVE
jgi:uncharacterized membrane protein YvbJ